jgi:ADP-ribose pyrophosphatase
MHLFFVTDAVEGESSPEDDEEIELVRIPVRELPSRLGEVEDGKTLVGILLYLRRRGL